VVNRSDLREGRDCGYCRATRKKPRWVALAGVPSLGGLSPCGTGTPVAFCGRQRGLHIGPLNRGDKGSTGHHPPRRISPPSRGLPLGRRRPPCRMCRRDGGRLQMSGRTPLGFVSRAGAEGRRPSTPKATTIAWFICCGGIYECSRKFIRGSAGIFCPPTL
jgi:hypothetical protein